MPQSYRNQLADVLRKHSNLFAVDDFEVGTIPGMHHVINTGDAPPFRQKLRRHPPLHEKVIEEQVQLMLKRGLCRPSNSPFVSNVVLAKKASGSWRLCIDHRQLNAQTVADSFVCPRVEDTIHTLSGAKYFSQLDIRQAYSHLLIKPEHIHKTAFIVKSGLYEMTKGCFGLSTMPASWSRAISFVLDNLAPQICACYFDDITIYSTDLPTVIDRIDKVLSHPSEFNLKLNPDKCKFLQTSIEILGYTVSADGVTTQHSKVTAIADWPACKTAKEVKSFLGICSYYRSRMQVTLQLVQYSASNKRTESSKFWPMQAANCHQPK